MIAAAVFIILITIIMGTWEIYKIRLASRLEYDQMSIRNFQAMDSLIRSPGMPLNWEEIVATDINTVQSFGLADSDHRVSEEKVLAFMSIVSPDSPDLQDNVTVLKDKLNIGQYGFLLRLENDRVNYSYGSKPSNEDSSVSTSRVVTFNDRASVITLVLYL